MATEAENDIARLAEEAASELLEAMPALATAQPNARSIPIMQALDDEQFNTANLKPPFRKTRHLAIFATDGCFIRAAMLEGWCRVRGRSGHLECKRKGGTKSSFQGIVALGVSRRIHQEKGRKRLQTNIFLLRPHTA